MKSHWHCHCGQGHPRCQWRLARPRGAALEPCFWDLVGVRRSLRSTVRSLAENARFACGPCGPGISKMPESGCYPHSPGRGVDSEAAGVSTGNHLSGACGGSCTEHRKLEPRTPGPNFRDLCLCLGLFSVSLSISGTPCGRDHDGPVEGRRFQQSMQSLGPSVISLSPTQQVTGSVPD